MSNPDIVDAEKVKRMARSLMDPDGHLDDDLESLLTEGPEGKKTILQFIKHQAILRKKQNLDPLAGCRVKDELDVRHRISELARGDQVSRDLCVAHYGLTKSTLDAMLESSLKWGRRRFKSNVPESGPIISRWTLELFFSELALIPWRQAAARLSMEVESLERLFDFSEDVLGFREADLGARGIGVREQFLKNLTKSFPALSNRIFGTHDEYCHALHRALKKEGVVVVPVCDEATSSFGLKKPDACYYVDCVTDEPIGLRYNVWLDFGKPISLEPDLVSIVTYAQFEGELSEYRSGHVEDAVLLLAKSLVGK